MGITPQHISHTEYTGSSHASSSDIMVEDKTLGEQPYAEHGAPIDHVGPQEEVVQAQPDLAWSRIRHALREPLSEFFGKFQFDSM